METIMTTAAPLPAGHYVQATKAAGLVFVSGQLPLPPSGMDIPAGLEAQVRQAMSNVEQVLIAAGSSLQHVLSVQLFIADVALWPEVNRVYADIMGTSKPARTIVPVSALHYGALIEVNAIAQVASCPE